jgi:hypothetical protein
MYVRAARPTSGPQLIWFGWANSKIDWTVDWKERIISGSVLHSMKTLHGGVVRFLSALCAQILVAHALRRTVPSGV